MQKHTDIIISTITKHLPTTEEEWELVGFVNKKDDIYTFGNDSKILGRLFEVITFDALEKSANELGFQLGMSEKQTVYPDYYFFDSIGNKIGIDVKTTYRRSEKAKFGFTGGSFTSFMRNGTKNIVGHYDDYKAHYILGVVYVREEKPTHGRVKLDKRTGIIPAYKDVEVFVQEKFRICGDKKGSGNTDNIGTIKASNIQPFVYGAGPFSYLGEDVFNHYWTNHPRYTDSKEVRDSLFTDLSSYISWIRKTDSKQASILQDKYDQYLVDYRKQTELGNIDY
ncbi:restriction endonuclease [Suicoccus acidiformans]|uniref:Restriction endonuclease n=1 Tax=Suicoccus acidiformans TaxID=2036206 RepID=A0A347WNW4_9LACT|nr:restriction endonuclease [Suicoccus acidiformans]